MWQLVLPQIPVEGGSLMQMNMASFIVLDWLLTSLCTMLNWLGSKGCTEVALWRCMGEGAFRCSLTLSEICQILFTAVPVLSNMYTDKDNNLISETGCCFETYP